MTAKLRAQVAEAARKAAAEGKNPQQIARAATPERARTEADAKLDEKLRRRINEIAKADKESQDRKNREHGKL